MTFTFVAIATVIFGFIGMIWVRSSFFNAIIKLTLLAMFIFGLAIMWPTLTATSPATAEEIQITVK